MFVERRHLIRSHLADREIRQSVDDTERAGVDANFQSARRAALIRRAERMRAIGVARDGRFGVRAQCRESGEKWCRQKRHIARYHQHLFRGRLDQRRIETTERTRPRHAIRDDRDSGDLFV